jgi:C_GCAxxG_C_C family probable redox protein
MDAPPVPEVRRSAEELFNSGFYCAESVLLAIAKAHGVESDLLPSVATAFCSGMARSRGTCGALTGAVMGISVVLGRRTPTESVEPCYRATRRLIQDFEQEFGGRDCQALLGGCDLDTGEGQAMFKEHKLGRRCLAFTGRAAEIAERALLEGNR